MKRIFQLILMLSISMAVVLPAWTQDPAPDEILKSMSTYLGGLSKFSVSADVDSEIIDLSGQKLQFSSSVEIAAERPGKLNISRQGAFSDMEMIYGGKTLTLYNKESNAYAQMENLGTIDDAINSFQVDMGLDAPGADLFYSDAYGGLSSGVVSSTYLGTDYVNGAECHHLAFREAKTDWQLWVRVGDAPLPMKYIITTKWLTGAPQYSVRFRNWNTNPQLKAGRFEFSIPAGARKLERLEANQMGELVIEKVEK